VREPVLYPTSVRARVKHDRDTARGLTAPDGIRSLRGISLLVPLGMNV
jgi:hypothetical protein